MQKMISFNNTTTFDIPNKSKIKKWLCAILTEESFSLGELNFLFCDDHHLHQLNVEFLNHDTLTDILTFDYNVGQEVYGDVCISVDRVVENAKDFNTSALNELHRVMAHGVLHLCGYKDSTEHQKKQMRQKEDHYLYKFELIR